MRKLIRNTNCILALVLMGSVQPAKAGTRSSGSASELSAAFQLTLTSFNYIPVNAHAACFTWSTSQEFDVEKFQLQASQDSNQFITVDEQPAINYKFGHIYYSPVFNVEQFKYYRLVMINENGTREYSKTISLSENSLTIQNITIYPNPIISLSFNIKVPTMNAIELNVFTKEGMLIYSTLLRGQFQYRITLPSSANASMNLVVQITNNGKTQSFNVLNK
jgi:hypothetical protein